MTARALSRPTEAFPDAIRQQRDLFKTLNSAIDQAETSIARHFKSFAQAIASKVPSLALPFMLDEYADEVDLILGAELEQLQEELALTIQIIMRQIMAVGAGYGQSQLGSILVDWNVSNPEVDAYLKKHGLELAKGLDRTTRERLTTVLRRGVREGQGVSAITSQIMDAAKEMSAERARLISQTEVLRGFNAGAVSLYKKSGVVNGLRWVDGQAGACIYCRALHGKIIRLNDDNGFSVTIGESTLGGPFPPGHPGCRCAVAPVLEEVSL